MEYNHKEIEKRWQQYWRDNDIYKVTEDPSRRKFYVLDMFPYPSGAGLHVGHPLGYIASDIYARYKRQQGFNVLHPMGYDAYGLPAEQYAIQTGQHPEKTTNENVARYRSQLDKIGFSFDWSREVRTCDPEYYKWTQWAFMKMFESYYDKGLDKAMPISELERHFAEHGSEGVKAACGKELAFTAEEWNSLSEKERSERLMNYRIAYLGESMVNWCPGLGTVLANDEVSEGVSVRGGFPVEQKVMKQWCLRVSAYAQRLLDGLDRLEWSDSLKETQRNWIGRSEGAEMRFPVAGRDFSLEIFTTRADTIFGVTFMVLAPESKYVSMLTTPEQKEAVDAYLEEVRHKTERERQIEKKVSGVWTGSYAVNPLTGQEIPVWVSDYVLAGYGTGAIMAVPAHDSRDYAFARHFDLPIIPLIEGADVSEQSFDAKEGIMMNSKGPKLDLNGLTVKEAIARTKQFIEAEGIEGALFGSGDGEAEALGLGGRLGTGRLQVKQQERLGGASGNRAGIGSRSGSGFHSHGHRSEEAHERLESVGGIACLGGECDGQGPVGGGGIELDGIILDDGGQQAGIHGCAAGVDADDVVVADADGRGVVEQRQ